MLNHLILFLQGDKFRDVQRLQRYRAWSAREKTTNGECDIRSYVDLPGIHVGTYWYICKDLGVNSEVLHGCLGVAMVPHWRVYLKKKIS